MGSGANSIGLGGEVVDQVDEVGDLMDHGLNLRLPLLLREEVADLVRAVNDDVLHLPQDLTSLLERPLRPLHLCGTGSRCRRSHVGGTRDWDRPIGSSVAGSRPGCASLTW